MAEDGTVLKWRYSPELAAEGSTGLFSNEDKRRQLDRILGYPEFQASERRQAMLRFIVEETLAGRENTIKGSTIAVEVFDREADFDPQADPVVRLEARKLRRDLDNYYVGPGRNDPIRINIPKGAYVPRFSPQQPVASGEAPAKAEPAPADPAGLSETVTIQRARPRGGLFPLWLVAVVLVGFVGVALASHYASDDAVQAVPSPPFDSARIAVTAFDASEGDDFSSLLAAGLSHDISAALLKFPDLRVHLALAPMTSETAAAAGRSPRPQTQFTVTGAIVREGNNVVVRSELRRNADSEVLWTETYSMDANERRISGISNEISAKIATVVGQQYGVVRSEIRDQLVADPSNPSLQAYACIARATRYRRTLRDDEYLETRHCLEETVLRQPDYARGWAMLAYLRNDGFRFGHEPNLTKDEALARGRQAASRALTLNPQDTDALKALSHIEHYAGFFDQSIDYARRAVELNPNDPETIGNLGVMLSFQGRFSEARPFLERAIERSISVAPRYPQFLAMAYMMDEDWEAMLRTANRAVDEGRGMGYLLVAIAHAALGEGSAAKENFEKARELWPLLTEDPKAALEVHKVDDALVDAFVAGLARIRATQPQ